MLLALKSGNFGGPEFFSDALKLMRRVRSAALFAGHLYVFLRRAGR
jgi:hypothetical protein